MSNEEEILTSIKEVRTELRELRTSLAGDKFTGKIGVMDILETHRRELYGNEATHDVGLKDKQQKDHQRIMSLEMDRKKVIWTAAGVSGALMGLWTLIKTFFVK